MMGGREYGPVTELGSAGITVTDKVRRNKTEVLISRDHNLTGISHDSTVAY